MRNSNRTDFLPRACSNLAAALLATLHPHEAIAVLAVTLGACCKAGGQRLEPALQQVQQAYKTTEGP